MSTMLLVVLPSSSQLLLFVMILFMVRIYSSVYMSWLHVILRVNYSLLDVFWGLTIVFCGLNVQVKWPNVLETGCIFGSVFGSDFQCN